MPEQTSDTQPVLLSQPQAPAPTQPLPQFQPVTNTPPPPHMKKSKAGILLIIIIIVFVLAAAAYASYTFLPNLLPKPDPKQELQTALTKLPTIQSVSFSANSSGEVKTTQTVTTTEMPLDTATFVSKTNGGIDIHALGDPKAKLDFSLDVHSNDLNSKIDAHLAASGIMANHAVYVSISSSSLSYVQAKPDSSSQFFLPVSKMLDTIIGQWIKITDIKSSADISFSKLAPIQNDLLQLEYVTSITDHGVEKVNNINTYHYTLVINTNKLVTILEKLDTSMPTSYSGSTPDSTLDVWIGTKDAYIYKISVPSTTYPNGIGNTLMTSQGEVTMSDYNKPLSVSPPATSKSLEEVLNQFLGGLVTSTKIVPVKAK